MSYYGTFSRNVEPTAVVAGARAGAEPPKSGNLEPKPPKSGYLEPEPPNGVGSATLDHYARKF